MSKISSHSGLPEHVELQQMEQKAQKMREKREKQMQTICGILDKMPKSEAVSLLAEVCRKYGRGWNENNKRQIV